MEEQMTEGKGRRIIITLIMAAAVLLISLSGCAARETSSEAPAVLPPSASAVVDTLPPVISPAAKDIVNPNQTYSYEQMMTDAQKLEERYPELVKTSVIGHSVEGRDLLLIRLGTGPKKLLLLGAHHAREYITATFLMETVDEYAHAFASGKAYGIYDLVALFSEVTVFIVPMVNPDGVNLVQNGVDAASDPEKVKGMRMLKDSYAEWKANINGVDLNRQYPCFWDEKRSNTDVPSSEMYKGSAPATEPEVQAVMTLCEQTEFLLAASFHTKGEVIYWADSGTEDAIAAGAAIAQSLSDVSGYELMPVSEDPAVYGAGFENWFRQDFERPAFCVELSPAGNGSAPHDDQEFESLVWRRAKYVCALLIEQTAN
jgi:hypothetical protein